ncbi:MAG: SDR family oxidoreductase [Succinivibrio sp.]|nr:SDR family oxidoreductase [Succinivibrio sp.]
MSAAAARAVFISGSAGGLGRALVRRFYQGGWQVIAQLRAPNEDFTQFCESLYAKEEGDSQELSSRGERLNAGGVIEPLYFDLTDSPAREQALRELISRKVPLKALINNAAVAHGGFFQMTPLEAVRAVFEVNFFAALALTQGLLRLLRRQGGGSVVNIGSIAGLDLSAGNCAYGVSKAALLAFTRTLAAETAGSGIRVNAVAPGLLNTGMGSQTESKAAAQMLERSALHRKGEPQEVAEVVYFLCQDEASLINGEIVRTDGGRA